MTTRYAALAYGDSDVVFRRAAMLFISLAAYAPAPAEFVILTDDPDRARLFDGAIRVETITPAQLTEWRGSNPVSMREKIEAVRRLLPSSGTLVMVDVDCVAMKPLDPMIEALHAGSLFMHKREFELGASRRAGNRRLWEDLDGRSFAGRAFQPSDAMWNSGVIALGSQDAPLIDSALTLYDALGDAGVRHFMIEQLAVGAGLERTNRLLSAEQYFAHYWGNKPGFDKEIASRLAVVRDSGWTLPQAGEAYRLSPIDLPLEVRAGRFEKLAKWLSK